MRWQADACCSRIAGPRRRLVRRVLVPAARAAQPSEHEDLLGSAMSRNDLGTCNLWRVHSITTNHIQQLNVESGFGAFFFAR